MHTDGVNGYWLHKHYEYAAPCQPLHPHGHPNLGASFLLQSLGLVAHVASTAGRARSRLVLRVAGNVGELALELKVHVLFLQFANSNRVLVNIYRK